MSPKSPLCPDRGLICPTQMLPWQSGRPATVTDLFGLELHQASVTRPRPRAAPAPLGLRSVALPGLSQPPASNSRDQQLILMTSLQCGWRAARGAGLPGDFGRHGPGSGAGRPVSEARVPGVIPARWRLLEPVHRTRGWRRPRRLLLRQLVKRKVKGAF